jgi:hypothetical protein
MSRDELIEWPWISRLLMSTAGGVLTWRGIRQGGTGGRWHGRGGAERVRRRATHPVSDCRHDRPPKPWAGRPPRKDDHRWRAARSSLGAVEQFREFAAVLHALARGAKDRRGHSHWVAAGPAAVPVEWDTDVTDWVPRQFIGWRSHEESPLRTSGQVRFRRTGENQTEIDLQLIYTPVIASEHAVAAVFGAEPAQSLSDDLGRMQFLLEEMIPERTSAEEEGAVSLPRRRPRRGRPKKKS